MFCPNCGAQNNDEVLNCQKCGFKIKESPASKFKGTMLMMNAPPNIAAMGGPPAAAPAPTAPVAVPPTGPMPGAAAAGSVAANASAAPAVTAKANFKGTMIGVAPPSLSGPAAPAAAPVAGAPHNFSHAPSTTPASPGALQAGVAPPMSPVNPLGGTLVAGDRAALGVHGTSPTAASPVATPPAQGFGGGGGDAFGSTLPSPHDARPGFASTTPSAGNQAPNFANMPQGGVQPTRPMAQAPGTGQAGPSQGILITLIVILCVSLAALVWTVLR